MTDEFYQCTNCGAVEGMTSRPLFKWRNLEYVDIGVEAKKTLLVWFLAKYPHITEDEADDAMLETFFTDTPDIADDLCEIFECAREQVCKDCDAPGPFVLHSYIE